MHDALFAVDAAGFGGPPGGKAGLSDFERQYVNFFTLFLGHVGRDDNIFAAEMLVKLTGKDGDVFDAVVLEVFDEPGGDDIAGRIEVDDRKNVEAGGKVDAAPAQFMGSRHQTEIYVR